VFKGVLRVDLRSAISQARILDYRDDEVIIARGDPGDRVFVIKGRALPSGAFAAFLGAAMLCAGTLPAAAESAKQTAEIDLTQWPLGDIALVRADPFGVLVKYGYTLFTDTANQIGPTVADPARRFAGNNLACGNCHLQAGRVWQKQGSSWKLLARASFKLPESA
jgi:hypothetical protein